MLEGVMKTQESGEERGKGGGRGGRKKRRKVEVMVLNK